MCKAISDIRAEGKVEGIMFSIINIMQSLNLTFEQAFAALKLPTEMEEEYRKMVDEAIASSK